MLHSSHRDDIIDNTRMANTFTQIHLQIVFAVQNRISLIQPSWKDELYKYMTGIVKENDHKLLIINGMPDHIHLLIGMRPTQSLSELVQDIKGDSSKWINSRKFVAGKFQCRKAMVHSLIPDHIYLLLLIISKIRKLTIKRKVLLRNTRNF